jgi:hypothetical protein
MKAGRLCTLLVNTNSSIAHSHPQKCQDPSFDTVFGQQNMPLKSSRIKLPDFTCLPALMLRRRTATTCLPYFMIGLLAAASHPGHHRM